MATIKPEIPRHEVKTVGDIPAFFTIDMAQYMMEKSPYKHEMKDSDKIYYFPYVSKLSRALTREEYREMYKPTLENEQGAMCSFCLDFKPWNLLTSYKIKEGGGRVCKACDAKSELLITHLTEERQNKAQEYGLTPLKDEELSEVWWSEKLKGPIRFDSKGRLYTMCNTCFVWKPRTLYFYPSKDKNPKLTFRLRTICHGCIDSFTVRRLSSFSRPARKEAKVRGTTSKKDHRPIIAATNIVFLLWQVKGTNKKANLVAIFLERSQALDKLEVMASLHDPVWRETNHSEVFWIEAHKVIIKQSKIKKTTLLDNREEKNQKIRDRYTAILGESKRIP